MLFSSFNSLDVLLTVIVLVRILLNQANFTPLVTVCFTSLFSFQVDNAAIAIKAPRPPEVESQLPYWKLRPAVCFIVSADPYKRILYDTIGQEGDDTLPKDRYEEFSTTYTLERNKRDAIAQVEKQLKKVDTLTRNPSDQAGTPTSDQEPTYSGFLTLSERHGSPGYSPYSVDRGPFSNREDTGPVEGERDRAKGHGKQLVPRDQSLSSSSDDWPDTSASPLESVVKDRHVEVAGFGLCLSVLFGTSRVALGVLRKLSYTQEIVQKMVDKGVPKRFFSWIHHSNPGNIPEKPLFCLMLIILAGNLMILYLLMKILHLIS